MSNPSASIKRTFFWYVGGGIATGTSVSGYIISPVGGEISKAVAYIATSPTGSSVLIDIHKNGTTIWTTTANRLTITSGGNTSTQTVFDVVSVNTGDNFVINIDQVGSTTAGGCLSVMLEVNANG